MPKYRVIYDVYEQEEIIIDAKDKNEALDLCSETTGKYTIINTELVKIEEID